MVRTFMQLRHAVYSAERSHRRGVRRHIRDAHRAVQRSRTGGRPKARSHVASNPYGQAATLPHVSQSWISGGLSGTRHGNSGHRKSR
jgi:hypothetical protein